MSQQQLDLAKSNYDAANASVGAAAANITQAEAQISQKKAAVTVAQTNLDYTVIRSPIDGVVVNRMVDVGLVSVRNRQLIQRAASAEDALAALASSRPGRPANWITARER